MRQLAGVLLWKTCNADFVRTPDTKQCSLVCVFTYGVSRRTDSERLTVALHLRAPRNWEMKGWRELGILLNFE